MNLCDGSRRAFLAGAPHTPASLAPAASVRSFDEDASWWLCPVCSSEGVAKTKEVAAQDLEGHMLNRHGQEIQHNVALAALTNSPRQARSIMELEPTTLPANMSEIAR